MSNNGSKSTDFLEKARESGQTELFSDAKHREATKRFNKFMKRVRANYKRKSTNSAISAGKVVLNS